jgi:hypothetical protein
MIGGLTPGMYRYRTSLLKHAPMTERSTVPRHSAQITCILTPRRPERTPSRLWRCSCANPLPLRAEGAAQAPSARSTRASWVGGGVFPPQWR